MTRPETSTTASEVEFTTSDGETVFFTGAEIKQIEAGPYLTLEDVAEYRVEQAEGSDL